MSDFKKVLLAAMTLAGAMALTACGNKKTDTLDYSKAENWVDIQSDGTKSVDVFFIYPTVVDETENEDNYASVSEMKDMAGIIRKCMASAYEDSCNVYMPYYRQASMKLADGCNKDNATYLDVLYKGKAYADIEAALDYYFENYNNGKPFILASHSQGSALNINILTHYMQEHKEYLSRMVASYALGYAPSEDIFNESTGLKFAACEDDYNVVISFNTEGPTAEGKSILLPENPMVINPLTWTTDDTYGSVDLNKGEAIVSETKDSVTIEAGKDDAQINLERKTLVCTTRSAEEYSVDEMAFSTESFHEKEHFMYYENIRENVQVRINAFLAGKETVAKDLPLAISQEEWADAKQYTELSTGIKMAYVEMGDPNGPVVILQHGMTDNSRSWSLAAPYFAEAGYHVYLPDLRGMGKSGDPDGYYTPITYATDLEAFFDAMNIDKATLVGHSLGSYTVQCFSIMFPERCEKVVLVSSAPIKGYQNATLMPAYQKYIEPLAEDEHPSDAFMDAWYATTLQEEKFSDVFDIFLANMKKEAQALSRKAWKNIFLGMASVDMTDLYSQIDHSIPVLVLHGDADTMALTQYQEELLEIFEVDENSYVNYEGIGHNIHFEMPEKCAADILTWIATGSLPE